jgi:hypothetical protein
MTMNNAAATKTTFQEESAVRATIDPRTEPELWIMNNQRITNERDIDGWLALYAPDAAIDYITNGAHDRVEGIDAIERSARALGTVFLKYGLRVEKNFVCATDSIIVNTWTGGFEGRSSQFGVEIWTLRGHLVARQEQYMFLEVQSSRSLKAQLRLLLAGEPRVMLSLAREAARAGVR